MLEEGAMQLLRSAPALAQSTNSVKAGGKRYRTVAAKRASGKKRITTALWVVFISTGSDTNEIENLQECEIVSIFERVSDGGKAVFSCLSDVARLDGGWGRKTGWSNIKI